MPVPLPAERNTEPLVLGSGHQPVAAASLFEHRLVGKPFRDNVFARNWVGIMALSGASYSGPLPLGQVCDDLLDLPILF